MYIDSAFNIDHMGKYVNRNRSVYIVRHRMLQINRLVRVSSSTHIVHMCTKDSTTDDIVCTLDGTYS